MYDKIMQEDFCDQLGTLLPEIPRQLKLTSSGTHLYIFISYINYDTHDNVIQEVSPRTSGAPAVLPALPRQLKFPSSAIKHRSHSKPVNLLTKHPPRACSLCKSLRVQRHRCHSWGCPLFAVTPFL